MKRIFGINLKKVFVLILSLSLCLGNLGVAQITASATETETERLIPTFFSDGMLFQRNKEMNIWGYGVAGETVTATLSKGGSVIESKTATTSEEGKWELSFSARAGSYDAYSIDINVADGALTKTISDVLVGELWIASGQSNMEFAVENDMDSENIISDAVADENNKYIRVYLEPSYSSSGEASVDNFAYLKDISGARWGYGNVEGDIRGMTAVGYGYADRIQAELNIPVGIIDCSVGGTHLEAWISRETIESSEEVKKILKRHGDYRDESNPPSMVSMGVLYAQRLSALEGMNIAGTIWYQGEACIYHNELYTPALQLLKSSWSEAFGFENGDMPLIFTQIAPFQYLLTNWGGGSTRDTSAHLAESMEKAYDAMADKNTAMLTIYDVPLEHYKNGVTTGGIHPRTKVPVAERFANSAINMLYGGTESHTAPTYSSMEVKDNAIYVTFNNVGTNGLSTTDGSLDVHGFAIAGEDNVFVSAKAEIVDSDTVKVYNNRVKDPKNVTYAWDDFNQGANLCGSSDIPASPFRSAKVDDIVGRPTSKYTYFVAQDWMYADKDVWVSDTSLDSNAYNPNACDYAPSFAVGGGASEYSYNSEIFAEGTASLEVSYNGNFSVSPIITYHSIKQDWSKFDYISLSVRSSENVNVGMTVTSGGTSYDVPLWDGNQTIDITGTEKFGVITFDLSAIEDSVLSAITAVSFNVTTSGSGKMYFDNFLFGMTDALIDYEISPVFDGIVSGGRYCGDVSFGIKTNDIVSVTVNGEAATFTAGKCTLSAPVAAGHNEYEVIATDGDGKITKATVKVFADHEFVDYRTNKNYTCNADGTETARCANGCGEKDVRTDEGSTLSHKFTTYIIDENGDKTATCAYDDCEEVDTVAGEQNVQTEKTEVNNIHKEITKKDNALYVSLGAFVVTLLVGSCLLIFKKKKHNR